MTAPQPFRLTCRSCAHIRALGGVLRCHLGYSRAPDFGGPGRCSGFVYQPGSDEREDHA